MGMPRPPHPCLNCKWFGELIDSGKEPSYFEPDIIWACEAFPNGIPKEIRDNKNKHKEPIPGDSGIQFEQFE